LHDALPIWFSFTDFPELTFEKPDTVTFRNLALAYRALEIGGNMPCVLNAANEVVVAAFLKGKVGFLQMSDVIEEVMGIAPRIASPTMDDCMQTDQRSREVATGLVAKFNKKVYHIAK